MKLLSNKCGSCGYTLTFDPDSETLVCSHCGSSQNINSELLKNVNVYDENAKIKINESYSANFECENCGAKSNRNNIVSGTCPYCGSHNLKELAEAFKFKADGIVPFKVSKKTAKDCYKAWLRKKHFVPNNLKSSAELNKMEGYYFPCFSFNFDIASKYSGVGVREHYVTRTVNGANGPRTITETRVTHHPISGFRKDSFSDMLINANNLVTGFEVERLGNYGLENLKVFNPAYLLGFITKETTFDVHKGYKQAKNQADIAIKNNIECYENYSRIDSLKVSSVYSNQTYNYIYLPVWICNFIYKQKDYKFLVNGFTGYVTGKVPRSPWKIFGLVMGILLGITLVVLIGSYLAYLTH